MMMKDSCGILYCNRAVFLDTIKKSIDNANDLSDKKEDVCRIMYSRNGKDYLDSCHLSYYLLFCLLWICMMIDREAISSAEAAPFMFGIAFWLTFAANIIRIYDIGSYYEWPILFFGFSFVAIQAGPILIIYYVFSAFELAIHPDTVCKILFFS